MGCRRIGGIRRERDDELEDFCGALLALLVQEPL